MSKFKVQNGWTKTSIKRAIVQGNNGTRATEGNHCAYLTKDGNKCAVGCFIPDGHPAQNSQGRALMLSSEYPELRFPLEIFGMRLLQMVHDSHKPTDAKSVREVMLNWIDQNVED